MTNLDNILKSRDIILPTNDHMVKVMVFPRVMYGCKSWTTKKAEHQRIDIFKLWFWRRLLNRKPSGAVSTLGFALLHHVLYTICSVDSSVFNTSMQILGSQGPCLTYL